VKLLPGSGEAGDALPQGLPGAFRFSQVASFGVSESKLRRWLDQGLVERVGRGAYQRVDVAMMDPDRLEVALRAPKATICLISGLVEHDLLDDNPPVLDLALPRGVWHPSLASPVRWHSFAVETFELDRMVIALAADHLEEGHRDQAARTKASGDDASSGVALGLYGPRRCIIDAFRLRHEVGPEVGVEALKRWLRGAGNPRDLLQLAVAFPASLPSLTAALRVLL
jgi:hypothetical protein